jgi:Cu/Zn superoxide dismutase
MAPRHHIRTAALAAATIAIAFAPGAIAGGATVTRGEISAFATGLGQEISGRAQMIRTGDGKTIVSVHVTGLASNTPYAAHVHQLPCGTSDADGHYKNDPAGPAAPPNEIWPGFCSFSLVSLSLPFALSFHFFSLVSLTLSRGVV